MEDLNEIMEWDGPLREITNVCIEFYFFSNKTKLKTKEKIIYKFFRLPNK